MLGRLTELRKNVALNVKELASEAVREAREAVQEVRRVVKHSKYTLTACIDSFMHVVQPPRHNRSQGQALARAAAKARQQQASSYIDDDHDSEY